MSKVVEGLVIENAFVAGEREFALTLDEGEGQYLRVRVHPWDRERYGGGRDRSVFLDISIVDKAGRVEVDAGNELTMNAIIPRDQFAHGVASVFEELTEV